MSESLADGPRAERVTSPNEFPSIDAMRLSIPNTPLLIYSVVPSVSILTLLDAVLIPTTTSNGMASASVASYQVNIQQAGRCLAHR